MSDAHDSFDETYRSLYEQGLTDGLPVVPPTEERVEEMLRGTDLPPEHVLGRIGNADNPITVGDLAANAVMAGCIPPYMPVLEAGARAFADPDSNSIQSSVSTGSWAYQWIVNGPVRNKLDIESGTGALGPNYHANQTISRALGIAYRNTAKIYPGEKDMGVMGNPAKFYLLAGENEEASPWEPFHVTNGYDEGESTITLSGPNGWTQWLPSENTAEKILDGMIRNTPQSMRSKTGENLNATITHAINPYNAEELAEAGLSKDDIKGYLVENSNMSTDSHPALLESSGTYGDTDVPRRQVPQYSEPESVKLATVGGPGRFNAIVGMSIGGPVTEKITFPDNWESLVEEYEFEREWVPAERFYD
ncbi:hypothetical protein [Halobellus salinisoli]|uniref:hypothetical protein n=1 Tax=Halobellus salinisoli TaxID=3108500 RepID=UPI0030098B95